MQQPYRSADRLTILKKKGLLEAEEDYMRLISLALLVALSMFAGEARNWQGCRIKYGERISKAANHNTVLVNPGASSILFGKLGSRDKKSWYYVVDAGEQFYLVESKSSLDIDIDKATKYARKGDNVYILDRDNKERTLKLVRQMSREEAEATANSAPQK